MAGITNRHGPEEPVESVYLKTLVEVVRTGSLSRAAETLAVTQPAVSRRIKFLEEHYGAPLLDRSGSHLRPTDAGRLVYQKAVTLLEIEDELIAGLHRLEGKARISFSSTPTFGTAHLPDILREFMLTGMDTADLKFTFQSPEQILAGLDGGLFDVAVMEILRPLRPVRVRTADLPGDEVVYVTAPSIDLAGPEARMDDVLRLPLFVRSERCCSRLFLEDNLHAIGHALRGVPEADRGGRPAPGREGAGRRRRRLVHLARPGPRAPGLGPAAHPRRPGVPAPPAARGGAAAGPARLSRRRSRSSWRRSSGTSTGPCPTRCAAPTRSSAPALRASALPARHVRDWAGFDERP